ncbi:Aste57867_1213 [Aphanomyces stellatus]|uniref:Aste57867_1213 protein n=1 Tax=Aphanomyces stellatus TaxID=120398 RepID=A0A485K7Z9_9STRA|nr:hypothetical protein As57867_001212 [Aphanomyces stellatus]VFT78433.1 Aste57867_1213 [Aphanomyces stellatus]
MSMTSFLIRRISRENDEMLKEQQQNHHHASVNEECEQLLKTFRGHRDNISTYVPRECHELFQRSIAADGLGEPASPPPQVAVRRSIVHGKTASMTRIVSM